MRWFVFALALGLAAAHSSGASACDAENFPPEMGGTLFSLGWSLSVNPSAFVNSQPIVITVNGPTGSAFRGIQMYVEDPATNVKYGSWASKSGFGPSAICNDGPAFTHTSASNKTIPVSFTWNAPAVDPGVPSLAIRVLVLWQGQPQSRMWAVLSATIDNNNAVSVAPTRAPTTTAPTTAAPSMGPTCTDGIKNGNEIGPDCGGDVCPACANYVWRPSDWTPCSKPCGGGIQTRSVICVDGATGMQVSAANCTGTHEAETSMNCNPDPCPNYSWKIGPWEACSSPCNTGSRTRSVTCLSDVGNVTVPDVNCGGTQKPAAIEDCNTDPCTKAHWSSQPWSLCSATCGGGTQTRTVQCLDENDVLTSDTSCTDTKPLTTQTCNNASCVLYLWNPCPNYYPCTATCNGGTGMLGVRYKDVFCVESDTLKTVDETLCDFNTKPKTNVSSCNPQPCTGYNWMANGNWGPCEKSAEAPFNYVRTRTFHCHAKDGSSALNLQCANVPQPIASLECTPNTCLKVPGSEPSTTSGASAIGITFVVFVVSLMIQ